MARAREAFAVILLVVIGQTGAVYARDGWEGRPHVCDMAPGSRLEKCQTWIQTVRRPDYRGASCCGDGDAYIADNFELVNGELYAIVTVDYADDDPNNVKRGDKILIPLEKRNHDPEDAGNTSGHGVVFLYNKGQVLCYFAPPLT
jgi:hypothetical protein